MAKTENQEPPKPAETPVVPATGIGMIFRWLASGTVRHAIAMRKHVEKLLNHQRDILTPPAIEAIQGAIQELRVASAGANSKPAIEKQMENLEKVANKWLKPYPNAAWRENVEVLLVALAVAMGIRTFFVQPFKIPTGSMQPTLYGVTSQNLLAEKNFKIPSGWDRVKEWFAGVSYVHVVAENDGPVTRVEPPVRLLIFNIKQTLVLGGRPYTIWFPPDYGEDTLERRAGLEYGRTYRAGEEVIKLRVAAGDHLFVDRLTYNFRIPERGETIVFETKGIPEDSRENFRIRGDQFYIKRLVGLSGETLALKPDYEAIGVPMMGAAHVGHLIVNGQPITASTPHFANLYTFYGGSKAGQTVAYQPNHYYGHALIGNLEAGKEFQVRRDHLFVMGDNTMNSLDSRYWGDFPANYVVGKSFFVYWPITDRFGWGYHR